MKTLKNLLLSLFVIASVGSMAQNEIKMQTGSVNIGDGKTYYFYDSGGEEEMTEEEDPDNNYRWKTWYNHNEVYVLQLKVPENSTKGIKVTFRSLLINNDHLRIYDGSLADTSASTLIVDLTNNDFSTGYNTFSVMSHGDMTIRFQSDYHWRDAGWVASITLEDYKPQAPVALMQACANNIVLLPCSKAAGNSTSVIYYTTDGNEPTANSNQYSRVIPVAAANTTVKAVLVEGGSTYSDVSTYTFDQLISSPTKPQVTRLPNTNLVELKANKPNGLNDTWYVRYTLDGTDPTGNGSVFDSTDMAMQEVTETGKVIAVVHGTTCSTDYSDTTELTIDNIYIPDPVISFTGNDNAGTAAITCAWADAEIFYTTDGSEPDQNSTKYTGTFAVTAGTTVKAKTYNENYVAGSGFEPGYASDIYIPGGEGGSGTYGGVVLLDDREDHSWSYYSDTTNPIRSLKPADVKITYKGFGANTMTSTSTANMPANADFTEDVESSQVAVNVGETENQFIYLKTLENANEAGTGNYPYTMIPNPFQVRPTYGSSVVTTSTVYISGSAYGNSGVIRVTYVDANGVTQTWQRVNQTNQTDTITVKDGTTLTVFAQGRTGNWNNGNYSTITTRYNNAQGTPIASVTCNWSNYEDGTESSATVGTASSDQYRGFYAWRVKSLSSGLSITDGTNTYGVNSIIYPDQEIEFVTANAKGNEVEFEALWAQAYVNSNTYVSNSGNYQNAYERNFKVGNSITTYNYPVTFSTIYPDGTGTKGTVNQGNYTCSNDVKFENINFTGASNGTYTAAGYDLIFGRGISGTINTVRGHNSNSSVSTNLDYTIRVENGTYGNLYLINAYSSGTTTYSGTISIRGVIGCDYDRASNNNNLLSVASNGSVKAGERLTLSNSGNQDRLTFDWNVKSGKIQENLLGEGTAAQSLYMTGGTTYQYNGKRRLVAEGGEFASIAGGIDGTGGNGQSNYSTYNTLESKDKLYIRIKGQSHVRGAIYGAAEYAGSAGGRTIIITGGQINGWIAGGCNGTKTDGGELKGETYIYFGGKAQCNSNGSTTTIGSGQATGGNIFGAGSGNSSATGDTATVGRVNSSTIVIADSAVVERNVYGGGNYGYVRDTANAKSDIYVLGGTVKGSVFGGSNMQQGQNVIITMKGGVVKNIYGGSNTQGTINDSVTISITGGTIDSNVFGGGYGNSTKVVGSISLTIGDTASEESVKIGGDVYGGSALGLVNTNTTNSNAANANKNITLTVNNGTINGNVYGGGLGNNSYAANVGTVTVNINGGKLNKVFGCNNLNGAPQGMVTVNFADGEAVDVYGGGNEADYTVSGKYPVVNITGGLVSNNVYGGGSLAKVNKTIVNMTGGEANNVFAGAEGSDKTIKLVTGNKTVNMQGGAANAVYGGSFTCLDTCISFVNISGGHVKTHVYGSGYFGDMHGDCYIYVGENAVKNAPHHGDNADQLATVNHDKNIWIENNIYAGANWGNFNGTFGASTITGTTNIYIDGKDYNMEHGKTGNYMIIGGSVYGSGTSSEAGTTDHSVTIRNYGTMTYPSMTRSLQSIQRVKDLIIDNSNIDFVGQGDISSMDVTVQYGMCNIDTIRLANATNIALSKPLDMVHKLGSYTCGDVYANNPSFTDVEVGNVSTAKNGIVINNGGYLMVRYEDNNERKYGELQGYFYMREPGDDAGINNEGYIFARPKLIPDHGTGYIDSVNTKNIFINDGGFVDYDASGSRNVYDENGDLVPEQQGNRKAAGTAVQMAYTNRTETSKIGSDRSTEAHNNTDYRFWRFDPDTVPTVTREIVFVVKADEEASATSEKFLTTTGSVQFPPALGEQNKYYITSLTWGADGKDCNPADYAKTTAETSSPWLYYDYQAEDFATKATLTDDDLSEYYANPNSTFGFLMQFGGNLASKNDEILSNESYASYYKDRNNALAEVDATNTTDLPQLGFLVTYSDRLSQNELWSEARMVIDEVDATGAVKQRIYLNISVTTSTKFGSNVETYVYASTSGNKVDEYTASLNLPTFTLNDVNLFKAEFRVGGTEMEGFNITGVELASYGSVENTSNLAMQFNAAKNGDNTQGWLHMGDENYSNQSKTFDFKTVADNTLIGAADGRVYTTVEFTLQYDPRKLAEIEAFQVGQKYVGDLILHMNVSNVEANQFTITVHVYVTGPTKFYYLDGVAGKDGNSGMFPDQAKRTLNGVINSDGFTVNDPIFVVNGVQPKPNGSLTWDASKFLNAVTVEDESQYTEEALRQLSQVKVFRYPGYHPRVSGDTSSTEGGFQNVMYTGSIVNVPENTSFTMRNVSISGGSDLDNDTNYNPMGTALHSDNPLLAIGESATVNIENASLINNNNISTDNLAGAIYNKGTLIVDGIHISDNASTGKGTGICQKGIMQMGNTQMITIADQIYLDSANILEAPHGALYAGSQLSDITVYAKDYPVDTAYSGRVIVRYTGYEPTAPEAPFWKTLVNGVPQTQSNMLKSRKAAEYESDKYTLNSTDLGGFEKANGGDENAKSYITYKMQEEFSPAGTDIIMYTTQANLPVELLYFTAECMGEATQLQWSTASETNNEYFTIERSSDAVNYEEVARIQGAGTTSQRSDYSFMVDNNSNAITYYRLRQTDIDGKYEIFAPIAIQCQNNKAATEISIYPVPANDQVNIFSSNSPMTRIEIYSIMGAKVAEESAEGNQAVLNISNLATGVYAVKVFTEDGQVSNVRLIKK